MDEGGGGSHFERSLAVALLSTVDERFQESSAVAISFLVCGAHPTTLLAKRWSG
jgi:hypothetical protein